MQKMQHAVSPEIVPQGRTVRRMQDAAPRDPEEPDNPTEEEVMNDKVMAIIDTHQKWLKDDEGECADFSCANLSHADLSHADLSSADLSSADLRHADLSCTNLSSADLSHADLSGANLSGANLSGADLRHTDLSCTKGLLLSSDYIKTFERDADGYIVYRAERGTYNPPDSWKFKPGAFLSEVPNPCRTVPCGCGVNFATREWVEANHPNRPVWKCRIRFEDLADVVVPYNVGGKARCTRLELLEIVGGTNP